MDLGHGDNGQWTEPFLIDRCGGGDCEQKVCCLPAAVPSLAAVVGGPRCMVRSPPRERGRPFVYAGATPESGGQAGGGVLRRTRSLYVRQS